MVVRLEGAEAGDCEPVASALDQFTPLAEALRPGLHAFGTRGPSRYFGGDQALAELVARASAEAAPSASIIGVGAADGLFTAGLAARAATDQQAELWPRPRRAAPVPRAAADQRSSSGQSASTAVLVVPPQQSQPFLAGLPMVCLADPVSPLSAEDGTEALLDVLWRLGIRTLGDVAELSEADMLGRFGRPGLLAHRLARGFDDRPLQARPAPQNSAMEAEVDPPADRLETVAFMARALADAMVDRLARDGLDCVSIAVETESDSGHASRRRWRHELRFDAAAVFDRVRWQLEGWYRSPERPTGPVTLIRITPCAVAPADGRQLGMWGERSEADERAARALARVQGLLGPEAVTVPRLAGGRRPSDIGRRVLLETAARSREAKRTRKKSEPEDAPWSGRLPSPLPAVVLTRPEPIAVTDRDGTPVTVSGRGEVSADPWQISSRDGKVHRVAAWAGPWPLDERWWRPSARRRQARFQLVLDDGSAHLCVLEAGRWHHEATYD